MQNIDLLGCHVIEKIPNSKCCYVIYNDNEAIVKKYSDYGIFSKDLQIHCSCQEIEQIVPKVLLSRFPYIVYEKIKGTSIKQNPNVLNDLMKSAYFGNILKRLHSNSGNIDKGIKCEMRMKSRYNNLSISILDDWQRRILYALKHLYEEGEENVCFIHGDLDASNVICSADKIVFVDWEKARVADIAWDFGSLLTWGILYSQAFYNYMIQYIYEEVGQAVIWRSMYISILSICEKVLCLNVEDKENQDKMLQRAFSLCVQTMKKFLINEEGVLK